MSPIAAAACILGALLLPWLLLGSCVVRAARRAVDDTQQGKHWLKVCLGRIIRATTTAILPIFFCIGVSLAIYSEVDADLAQQATYITVLLFLGLFLAGFLGLFLGLIAFGAGLYRLDRVVPAVKTAIVLLAALTVLNAFQGLP